VLVFGVNRHNFGARFIGSEQVGPWRCHLK
jgi:hypothetical protein